MGRSQEKSPQAMPRAGLTKERPGEREKAMAMQACSIHRYNAVVYPVAFLFPSWAESALPAGLLNGRSEGDQGDKKGREGERRGGGEGPYSMSCRSST